MSSRKMGIYSLSGRVPYQWCCLVCSDGNVKDHRPFTHDLEVDPPNLILICPRCGSKWRRPDLMVEGVQEKLHNDWEEIYIAPPPSRLELLWA